MTIGALLTTTSFLFANSEEELIEENSPEGVIQRGANEIRSLPHFDNRTLLKDDQGNWHIINDSKAEKESREDEAAQLENKSDGESDKEQEERKEDPGSAEGEVAEGTDTSADGSGEDSSEDSASSSSESKNLSGSETKEENKSESNDEAAEEIETVAVTPPRSPNVPSYSVDRVGIHHNDEGAVTVVYPGASEKRLRVLVEKGGERSAYNLHDGTKNADAVATYPLERGDGTYLVRIMENTEGNSYRELHRKEVTLKSQQKHAVYLNSIQEINWSTSDPAIQEAARLTAGKSSDREKVRAVYDYMVQNVTYDHDKVDQLNTFYLPDINETFRNQKGICYDYASLFAAMLRSRGIPIRMVKGYSDAVGNGEVYHAWNEVYLADEGRWVIIDTTHDASHVQQGQAVDMIKGSDGFSVTHRL